MIAAGGRSYGDSWIERIAAGGRSYGGSSIERIAAGGRSLVLPQAVAIARLPGRRIRKQAPPAGTGTYCRLAWLAMHSSRAM